MTTIIEALLSPCYVLGIAKYFVGIYLIFSRIQRRRCCYCCHLIDSEIETTRDEITCLWPHSRSVIKLGFYLKQYSFRVHLLTNILFCISRVKWIHTAATWMDLEGTRLSEISWTEKDKYCMFSLICGMWKIEQRIEYNQKQSQTERANQGLPVGNGVRERQVRENGLRCRNYYV